MTHPTVVMFATGYNNIGGLATFPMMTGNLAYIPIMPGLMYAANRYAFNRKRFDDGRYIYIKYPRIPVQDFYNLNSFLGFNPLSNTNTVQGTWNFKVDFNGIWHYWNGTVAYIVNGTTTQRGFASWLNVQYDITGLEDLGV